MGGRRGHRRSGFTLVELSVVVMIVGILASVAVPAIQYGILKADGAQLVGDAHTVSLATYEYIPENGRFPNSVPSGTVPPQLAWLLPAAFRAGTLP